MGYAERAIDYSSPDRDTSGVFTLGVPSSEMAAALGRAGIASEAVGDAVRLAELVQSFATSTLLVPAPRWGEIVTRAHGTRAFVVAAPGDFDAALRALHEGAEDVVSAEDDAPSLRRLIGNAPRVGVGDGSAMPVPRLAELSAEVAKIARALDGLAQAEPAFNGAAPNGPALKLNAPQVRALIRARRARSQYFPVDLFADPAWDILLDLMASRLEGRQVSVSSLCIAAAVPATTALRWIKSMTDADLLERKPDPVDGRRVFIDLSQRAVEAMNAYMASSRGVVAV